MHYTYTSKQTPAMAKATSGFTLVEVLVAVTLLLIALIGPMTSIARSSQATEVANQQVPATFLAQEGVELVHKVRDDELRQWFGNSSHQAWSNAISDLNACFSNDGCGVTISNNNTVNVVSCSNIENCRLYYADANNVRSRYTHNSSGGEQTPYTRVIRLNEVSADREIEVQSEVRWRSGRLVEEQQVTLRTAIFNIYDTN